MMVARLLFAAAYLSLPASVDPNYVPHICIAFPCMTSSTGGYLVLVSF